MAFQGDYNRDTIKIKSATQDLSKYNRLTMLFFVASNEKEP